MKFRDWLASAKEPPPDPARFQALFALFDEVTAWREPKTVGKRTYDDKAFVASVREQAEREPEKLSERQLRVLASMAASYREQIPEADARLSALGWGDLVARHKEAPDEGLVKDCFAALEATGGFDGNKFLISLRRQFDQGRALSEKQFAVLARTTLENLGEGEAAGPLRAKLAALVPDGAQPAAADPALPGLLAMLEEIGYMEEQKADHMMQGIHRVFSRGVVTKDDAALLLGVARQAVWAHRHPALDGGRKTSEEFKS